MHNAANEQFPERGQRQRQEVVAALGEVLPRTAILFHGEDTVPYECDALTAYRTPPMVVVLPETEAQVAAMLRICHRLGVPVVARGAGTGLSGGATPHRWGVTLSLAKFNSILKIDPAPAPRSCSAACATWRSARRRRRMACTTRPIPSSQIACTIGGNVAENSGGVHCLKYGLTLHNVLRVRGFMADGEPVEFGSMALDARGPRSAVHRRRQRGHAGGHHRSHGETDSQAAAGPLHHGELRRHRIGRRRGGRA